MSLFSFNICSCFCLFHYSLKIATTLCCPLETITTLLTGYQSVQFSCSVMYDSLRPHESQHARPPCPSPTPGVHSNSCPSSRWCHPTISPSVVPFSSHLQSFPASGAFPMSQFIASHGQSFGASASVFPMNIQNWFPLGWTDWISLQSKGHSRVFYPTPQFKSIHSLALSFLCGEKNMTTGKTIALTRQTFVGKVMSLLFRLLSPRQLLV